MGQNTGTLVTSAIRINDSNDPYSSALITEVQGGRKVVANLTALYALSTKPLQLLQDVTIVSVLNDGVGNREYKLVDLSNAGNSAGWQLYVNYLGIPSQTGNSGKFLTTNGTNLSWGTPISPYKGNWVSGVVLSAYDLVYGNYLYLNKTGQTSTTNPTGSTNVTTGSSDASSINAYLGWSTAQSQFTPIGAPYLLQEQITINPGSSYPLFTFNGGVNIDNPVDFYITQGDNNTNKGIHYKYHFTQSMVPHDGAWHELLPYFKDNATLNYGGASPSIDEVHVDCAYRHIGSFNDKYEFRIRTVKLSGVGAATPQYIVHVPSNGVINDAFTTSIITPSLYWSILNGGTDPNTILPNWKGIETNTIAVLPGVTQLGDNLYNSAGKAFAVAGSDAAHVILGDGTYGTYGGSGSGTVTTVSGVNVNGFTLSIATATTTPAITLGTSITGLLKGNGTAISAASAGTDYLTPAGSAAALTGLLSSQVTAALTFTPENVANKATNFAVLNNTKYPTTQAVENEIFAQVNGFNGLNGSGAIQLGGLLISSTDIDTDINVLSITTPDPGSGTSAVTKFGNTITSYFTSQITGTSSGALLNVALSGLGMNGIVSSTGAGYAGFVTDASYFSSTQNPVIIDQINSIGLREFADYSANYNARNYISKGYADARYATTTGITAYLPLAGGTLTGDVQQATAPVNSTSLINKGYVDNLIAGLQFIDKAADAASTANVNISSAPSSLDGIAGVSGTSRWLLKNQTTGSENGVYLFNGTGSALTRATDAATGTQLANKTIPVSQGTVNSDTWWTVTNDTIVIGTTALTIVQTGGSGTYTNGTGITLSGNIFSLDQSFTRGLVSATSPIFYNSATGVISSQVATSSQNGYLISTDWTTFNGKQAAGNYITALSGDATASGPGSSALTLATVNSNTGTFTNPVFTVNAKGLITAASNGTGAATSTKITREIPSGTINGVNKVFTLANTPVAGSEEGFVNGQGINSPGDYTISGATVTFVTAPTGTIWFNYQLASTTGAFTSLSLATPNVIFSTPVSFTNTAGAGAGTLSLNTQSAWTIFGNGTGSTATPTFFAPSLTSALFANQGTATTVLHGNAGGNPSFSQIVNADIASSTIDLTTKVTGILPVANGGTGTASPGLIQGTNITITGTWPNQTINAAGGGGTTTLTGAVTGSGTSTIATTLASSTVGISNLSATGTPSSTTYLRGDNTWSTPAGSGTVTSVTSVNADIGIATTTTTPVLTLNSGTGANQIVKLDGNINTAINNVIKGYATTVTAAATTTLTVSSTYIQVFTGSTTQTVQLPVASTLVLGQQFLIVNSSTGVVTVQSSGSNTIISLQANTTALLTCVLTSGTTAASWRGDISGITTDSGTGAMARVASPTFTGTVNAAALTLSGALTGLVATMTRANIVTTSANAFSASNTQAATSGVPVQYSPSFIFTGKSWNTGGTPASNQQDMRLELRPTSGATTSADLFFSAQNNGGGYTDVFKLGASGNFTALTGTVILKGFTVSGLPTGVIGMTAYVTDALTPSFGTTLVGGGAIVTKAFYNGSNWIAE